MKKCLVLLLSFMVIIVSYAQSQVNRTFYVYRNDGMFNAFYYSEVDSMLCSMIDTTGVEHDEYVVQEIYTTDSLYRIPISAIDSISFTTPKIEYRKDVNLIDSTWLNYIISVEDLSITVDKDIPLDLLPLVGQVIVAEINAPFDQGFAGRVSEINRYGDSIVVSCTDVTLKEIYKNLVYKGRSRSVQNAAKTKAKDSENRNEMETVYFDIPHSLSLNLGPLSLDVSPTIALDYIICINDEQTYIDNRITHYYDCSAQLTCNLTKEDKFVDLPLSFPIPTQIPGLYAEINVGSFFEYSGGVTISMTKPFTITGTTGYIAYDNHVADIDEWHFESKDTEFTANLNGFMRFGLVAQSRLSFVTDKLASIDVTGYFGPEVIANISFSSDGLLDGSLYTTLKESVVTLNAYGAIQPGWRFSGFEHQDFNYNPSFHFELNHWYILPEFNNLTWVPAIDTKGGKLYGGINRDLFWPGVQLGWALFDQNDKIYASQYYPETYRLENEWPWEGLEMDLNDLPHGSKFIAYPMIRIWDYEMRALPSTEVKIDPFVSTGNATNISETSAVISGYVEGLEYSMVADAGICYSTEDPITGDYVSSGSKTDGAYSIPLSGLASNTTYFYTAYAYYDGEYYYGTISSFKTKEQNDPNPEPDPEPDPEPATPVATTGGYSDVTDKSAVVECSFENVPEGGMCYVFLQWEENGEYKMLTYNSTEGMNKRIQCSDLKPATTYYYTAAIHHDGQEFVGEEKSFTTKIPDLTGWWTFNDAQGDGGRVHKVEFYADGTTNAFYGVNRLNWSVDGRNIRITWPSGGGSSVWWEYRGTFNEDFTVATGDAFYCFVNNVTGDYWEDKSEYQFSLSR